MGLPVDALCLGSGGGGGGVGVACGGVHHHGLSLHHRLCTVLIVLGFVLKSSFL